MPKPVRYEQLANASTALDRLCREASGDIRSQCRFDELEEEAQRIGREIVSAFRGHGKATLQRSTLRRAGEDMR